MSLTRKDIAEIEKLLQDSSFDELELEIDGLKIHLRRDGVARVPATTGERGSASDAGSASAAESDTVLMPALAPRAEDPALIAVRAPLLGNFYRAPKPGAPPFVEVGMAVLPDTIVGIIEVMKLMNTVRAGVSGMVREICAQDGKLVEHGETLLRIDPRETR